MLSVLKQRLGDKFKIETEVPSGLAPFDVYFPDANLVVEIDGTTHFYGLTDKLMPHYVAKRELLKKAGVDVLYLEYHTVLDKDSEVNADLVETLVQDRLNIALQWVDKGKAARNIFRELLAEDY